MHGTCAHLCLMANLQFNAAEYAMTFCLTISLASEASYHRLRASQCGQGYAGDLCSSNTLEADWGGLISHARKAL